MSYLAIPWPSGIFPAGSNLAFSNFSLDATNDAIQSVVVMDEAATITHAGFRYGARTGTPPTYRISLQSLGANGEASGTILGGGSPASATFTPPANATWDGTWRWVALDNSYTNTRGQIICVVIDYSAGTIDGSNNSSITSRLTGSPNSAGLPYCIQVNSGTPSRQVTHRVIAVKSNTTAYGTPIETLNNIQYSSDSTPDEYAVRFLIPSSYSDTYTAVRFRVFGRTAAVGKTLRCTLYDGTSVLQQVDLDTDAIAQVSFGALIEGCFDEVSLSSLTCGSAYRIGFAPQETAANFAVQCLQVDAAADLSAYPGGTDAYLSTRSDAGAWTDDTTQRPMVEIELVSLVEPSGGGAAGWGSLTTMIYCPAGAVGYR